jgi:hypothetical protein
LLGLDQGYPARTSVRGPSVAICRRRLATD